MTYKHLNNIERADFYLGKLIQGKPRKYDINDNLSNINNSNCYYYHHFKTLLEKTNNHKSNFSYYHGDNAYHSNRVTIVKNRIHHGDGVILKCLNFDRHWKDYYNKPVDLDIDNKIEKIIWRGTSTGQPDRPGNRFDLVEKWFNKHPNINIGFNMICQGKEAYSEYVKEDCSMSEMLKYKYILSIPGNDKDSGLNWKLNSNSVILMPRPRLTSWLMETTLLPGIHYVLLNDDYNDLEQKLVWCNNHQDQCKQIVKNANNFMDQFKNIDNEKIIEERVINKYFDIIK